MIYASHFDRDYLETEQKKKSVETKIERALINLPLPNSINLGFLPEAPSQKTFHPPKHS